MQALAAPAPAPAPAPFAAVRLEMATSPADDATSVGGGAPLLLPAGSVRSVIALNPPASSPSPSRVRRGRRGVPSCLSAEDVDASVAMADFFRDGKDGEAIGKAIGSGRRRVTLVASCIPPREDGDDDRDPRRGRISVAVVDSSDDRDEGRRRPVLGVRYSSLSIFSTVCLAVAQRTGPMLMAIDASGRLHACNITIDGGGSDTREDNQLHMQECQFGTTQGSAPKRGKRGRSAKKSSTGSPKPSSDSPTPPLSAMNVLAARLEVPETARVAAMKASASARSPPKVSPAKRKKSPRKRKHSPAKDCDGPGDGGAESAGTDRLFCAASNLNGCIPASERPPVIMVVSSDSRDDAGGRRWIVPAWSEVPGLQEVAEPMTCMLFASRAKCGPAVWDGIVSALRSNASAGAKTPEGLAGWGGGGDDDGVLLMGFRDGSLRASLVVAAEAGSWGGTTSGTINVSEAMTVLRLRRDEPLLSLQLLPSTPSTPPILICVGTLGTVVTLSSYPEAGERGERGGPPEFITDNSLKPCDGCLISLAFVGYHPMGKANGGATSLGLSFICINDSRRTFLHYIILTHQWSSRKSGDDLGDCSEFGTITCRLPIPSSSSASIHASLNLLPDPSEQLITFTIASPNGKSIVSRMSLPQALTSNLGGSTFLHFPALGAVMSAPDRRAGTKEKGSHKFQKDSSTFHSLIQKLELAIGKQSKNERKQMFDSINHQLNHATKEIREVTQMAAFVNRSYSRGMPSSPIQVEIMKANSLKHAVIECTVTAEKLPLSKQRASSWLPSVHIMCSCQSTLSPLLVPDSIDTMDPLCYRRNQRGERPKPVVYGGTATSYNFCNFTEGVEDSLQKNTIDISMNDYIPATIYASWSMAYSSQQTKMIHKLFGGDSWCKATKIVNPRYGYCQAIRACIDDDDTQTAMARRACFREYGKPGNVEILGMALPFEVGAKGANKLDILQYIRANRQHRALVGNSGVGSARDIAEKHVAQWYQNKSSQSNIHSGQINPLIKELQWIRQYSLPLTKSCTTEAKVYCCSSLVPCTSSETSEFCVNVGFGPVSIVILPNEAGFAVGSTLLTSEDCMSMLSLIRQAVVHQCMDRIKSRAEEHHDILKYMELFRQLLSQKKTARVAKYVRKELGSLGLDEPLDVKCKGTDDLATASISLYETMRSIQFPFHLH
ncbi:hypothetical protein ACHAWF_009148 [Thalassiosira exigua]